MRDQKRGSKMDGARFTPNTRSRSAKRGRTPQTDGEQIDWLHLVFDNTTDYALIVTDPAGIITQWKGVAEQIVGWTAADALGKSIALIFTPLDKAAGRPDSKRISRHMASVPDAMIR